MSEQMNARWVKSSLSFSNGNCVEAANLPGGEIEDFDLAGEGRDRATNFGNPYRKDVAIRSL